MGVVRYLTVDQVIEFHGEALREFGGLEGIRSQHQLSAAVQMPQQSAFGEDAYPSIPGKAAAYGFFIAEAQQASTATSEQPRSRWKHFYS